VVFEQLLDALCKKIVPSMFCETTFYYVMILHFLALCGKSREPSGFCWNRQSHVEQELKHLFASQLFYVASTDNNNNCASSSVECNLKFQTGEQFHVGFQAGR
jgi:hypothetical protein